MDPKIQERLLDRLAGLVGTDDGGRLEGYLETLEAQAKARADSQARLRQRKQDQGMRRIQAYLDQTQYEDLCKQYPGPRGGIDWQAVAAAALKVNRETR